MSDFNLVMTIPVRGDHLLLERFLKALVDTEYRGRAVFGFDDDDPNLENLVKTVDSFSYCQVEYMVAPRMRFVGTLNHIVKTLIERGDDFDAACMQGIDHIPRTMHFDKLVENALKDNVLCWGPDGIQDENMCSCAFVRTDVIKEAGYFVLPTLTHLYVEQYFSSVFGPAGINKMKYVPEMFIEHLHPAAGKAEWTQQYQEVNSNEMYKNDRLALEQFISSGKSQKVVDKLKLAGF